MLQYNLEDANNTFTARFGDRVGWTFLAESSLVVFSHVQPQNTFFYTVGLTLPTVGSIIHFNSLAIPATYSIAVRVDLSEFWLLSVLCSNETV